MSYSCGIDWAEGHHDVAIVDGDAKLLAKKRISDDPAGLSALTEMLAAAGDGPQNLIPIAIETPRGLLVAALRATGRPVFAINPMAVARYRERHSVAGAKSDQADAMTLANILRVDAPGDPALMIGCPPAPGAPAPHCDANTVSTPVRGASN